MKSKSSTPYTTDSIFEELNVVKRDRQGKGEWMEQEKPSTRTKYAIQNSCKTEEIDFPLSLHNKEGFQLKKPFVY